MKQNTLYQLFGAEDCGKLVGFTIVDVCDSADEEGNESISIELQNDFGVSIDVSLDGEIYANQPHVKDR